MLCPCLVSEDCSSAHWMGQDRSWIALDCTHTHRPYLIQGLLISRQQKIRLWGGVCVYSIPFNHPGFAETIPGFDVSPGIPANQSNVPEWSPMPGQVTALGYIDFSDRDALAQAPAGIFFSRRCSLLPARGYTLITGL